MFEVLPGGKLETERKLKEKRAIKEKAYLRMFEHAMRQPVFSGRYKAVFAGVKYIAMCDVNALENGELATRFYMVRVIDSLIEAMTVSEFITLFPISKEYDGAKYGMKDYFSVMEALAQYDKDAAIGKNVDKVLMEYYNADIIQYQIKKLMLVDHLRRMQGQRSMIEEFAEAFGIPTYTYYKKENLMHNNATGEWIKVQKRTNTSKLKVVT